MSQKTDTFEYSLDRVEHIDASHFRRLPFSMSSYVADGIGLCLVEMMGRSRFMLLHSAYDGKQNYSNK